MPRRRIRPDGVGQAPQPLGIRKPAFAYRWTGDPTRGCAVIDCAGDTAMIEVRDNPTTFFPLCAEHGRCYREQGLVAETLVEGLAARDGRWEAAQREEHEKGRGNSTAPRADAYAKAERLAVEHPDATIGVYPLDADSWVVLATLTDGSGLTSVFTRGYLMAAMLAAASRAGQVSVRGHDPERVTHRPEERSD